MTHMTPLVRPSLQTEINRVFAERQPYGQWPGELKAALHRRSRASDYLSLRFQLLLGLGISLVSLIWDAFAVPEAFETAALWRLLVTIPLALFGLFAIRRHQTGLLKLVVAVVLVSFGAMVMHIGSFASIEIMTRYAMATALLLGIAILALPFTPREMLRFTLAYILATTLAGIWPHPLPPLELLMHVGFSGLVGAATWLLARRYWEIDARAVLFDLRDDFTRHELTENNRLLQQLSEHDPLTCLPNRRHFERVFEERFAGTDGEGTGQVALMMLDLDHFKAFNDRHGHQAGDQCLRLAGIAIEAAMQGVDGTFARYGGEEFVVAMREAEQGDARQLAARLCAAIEGLPGRTGDAPLVTTSIGVAIAPLAARLPREELTEMADAALYAAKRAGRNRFKIVAATDRDCKVA